MILLQYSMSRLKINLHLTLTRKDSDIKRSYLLLDAVFDKSGQMINGKFPFKNLTFERQGAKNIRRMKDSENQYLSVAGNDREWDCFGTRITSSCSCIRSADDDNAVGGAFELFMEFARLHTSIFK